MQTELTMATEKNWEEILRTNYTDLLTNINTEFGLFGELKKARIFTPIALKSYMDCRDTTEKIDRMLRNLQKKDFESFKKFCEALKSCEQEHIVRDHLSRVKIASLHPFTDTDSPAILDLSHNRGISNAMSECFRLYWNDLVANINFDEGLLGQVEKRNIVTKIQLNKLRDMEVEWRRTQQMLSWLERGSEKQFLDFCDAVQDNNQEHIVKKYLKRNIPERKVPQLVPSVIHKNPTKPLEVRRNPEGAPISVPVPTAVTIKDICFSTCTPEFLNNVQSKVLKKIAYRCESKPRGRAVIMNNTFFCVDRLATREGSEVDTFSLQELFTRLHFDTVVHSNQDAEEMWEFLVKESRAEHHKQYDMFVLFLLSHGVRGEIFGSDGKSLKTTDIVNLFNGSNCPGLLTKPKLFFIQACQGDVRTAGVSLVDADTTACDSSEAVLLQDMTVLEMMRKLRLEDDVKVSIPLVMLPKDESDVQNDAIADDKVHEMADVAIIYATVEGYAAWRRRDTGSLFVQCLINALKEGAHETDLMGMITRAFNMLHELEVVENRGRYKQIGEKRDSLRKEVYLLPF